MQIHYTGKLEKFDAISKKKLDVRMARLAKLIDRRSEKELHVILKSERHLQRAELTLNFAGQPQAGIHAATDQLTALTGACDKLEKQLLKLRDKQLTGKRRAGKPPLPAADKLDADAKASPAEAEAVPARIYRLAPLRKPMTVEEALLELDSKRSYVAYRDAVTSRLSILIRRNDGHFDLFES